jgi:hypothetical protein
LGGRFPALAVFGLPALTVAIALVVLWGLRPWEDRANPHEAPLGIEMAVTGGKALPAASASRVGAGVAVPAGPKVQAAQRATGNAAPNPGPAQSPSPAIAVVPARAIAVSAEPSSPSPAAPEPGGGEGSPSAGATTGETSPDGTASPVASPPTTGGGSPKAPVTAGAKPTPLPESCEGDEYVITVTFLGEESTAEEAPVSIVLERLNEDGSSDELQLEGDLSDAHALASTLEAEGNCVKLEIAQPEAEEGAEENPGMEEAPESSEEAPVADGGAPESGEEIEAPAESPLPISP